MILNGDVHLEYLPDHLVGDYLLRHAIGNDAAAVNDDDAGSEPHSQIEVVEDRDHGRPVPGTSASDFDQLDLMSEVET